MNNKYKVIPGNKEFTFHIIDSESGIRLGSGEVGKEIVLTAHKKEVAEFCAKALSENYKPDKKSKEPVIEVFVKRKYMTGTTQTGGNIIARI